MAAGKCGAPSLAPAPVVALLQWEAVDPSDPPMEASKGLSSFGRLAFIVDLAPTSWAVLKQAQEANSIDAAEHDSLSLAPFLEQLFVFAHQYRMLNRSNRISIFALGPEWYDPKLILLASSLPCSLVANHLYISSLVYPEPSADDSHLESNYHAPVSQPFDHKTFREATTRFLSSLAASTDPTDSTAPPILSQALSRAFLLLNRQERDLCVASEADSELDMPLLMGAANFPARIIVFSLSPDTPSQIVPTMNAVFACNKKSIAIDSCVLGTHLSSPLLQVAAEVTGGYHTQVQRHSELTRLMMTTLLVDAPYRNDLKMPKMALVDHRATCFCHQRFVRLGYVCSVCLAVFCEPSEACKVCGIEFLTESLPNVLVQVLNQFSSTM